MKQHIKYIAFINSLIVKGKTIGQEALFRYP